MRNLVRRDPPQHMPTHRFAILLLIGSIAAGAIGWFGPPMVAQTLRNYEQQRIKVAAIEASVTYRDCREAWSAGAAPIHAGSPGYRREMDGDGDGIACEPYR